MTPAGPILVVGAGPVGLSMALALARQKIPVRIVDRSAARTTQSRALVVWPRTLEMLDIQGGVEPFLDTGMKAMGANILADGEPLVGLRFDTARSTYRHALMIPQSDTERLLEAQLATLGVAVERQVELRSFTDDGTWVYASLHAAEGDRDEALRCRYLVGCDGAHSTVRHGLPLTFEGDTLPSAWMLADIALDGPIGHDELTVCWTPDGVLAVFPITATRCRIVADVGLTAAGQDDPPPLVLADVQAVLERRGPPGLRARDPVWLSRFRINERKVHDYRYGRVFLAGDAAHVHSPAGGQGMNTGMQDAFNLAWKMALVCRGQAAPSLLDTYSPERSAIGDRVLANAARMTRAAILRNPILQKTRNLAAGALGRFPKLRQGLVDQLTGIDLHYADSPLSANPHGAARHPAGGDRAPDVLLLPIQTDAPARLHELLGTGRFAVLSVAAVRVPLPEHLHALATAALAAGPAPGYDPGHVYLVRPDAYVAMSTPGDDPSAIVHYLEQLQPRPPAPEL